MIMLTDGAILQWCHTVTAIASTADGDEFSATGIMSEYVIVEKLVCIKIKLAAGMEVSPFFPPS